MRGEVSSAMPFLLPGTGMDKPVQGCQDAGQDKDDEQGGGDGAAGDGQADLPDGRIGKHIAQDAGRDDHDQGGGQDGMQGTVIRPADSGCSVSVPPVLPVIGGVEDRIVYRSTHEDTLHHENGQVVHAAAAQPDEGHSEIDTALYRQHQHQWNDQGTEGKRDNDEDCRGGNEGDAVQL